MTCFFHGRLCRTPCPIVAAAQQAQRDEDESIAARQQTHGHAGKSRAQGRINGQRYGRRLPMPQPRRKCA